MLTDYRYRFTMPNNTVDLNKVIVPKMIPNY